MKRRKNYSGKIKIENFLEKLEKSCFLSCIMRKILNGYKDLFGFLWRPWWQIFAAYRKILKYRESQIWNTRPKICNVSEFQKMLYPRVDFRKNSLSLNLPILSIELQICDQRLSSKWVSVGDKFEVYTAIIKKTFIDVKSDVP